MAENTRVPRFMRRSSLGEDGPQRAGVGQETEPGDGAPQPQLGDHHYQSSGQLVGVSHEGDDRMVAPQRAVAGGVRGQEPPDVAPVRRHWVGQGYPAQRRAVAFLGQEHGPRGPGSV
ncbi:hypothetical protein PMKS-002693 [Pichia membranifaciens]|uniref:Uncharacterized protein n=1 Tax=Pichia membranifaciens TaxID=4926 RepID=A0A1Q2YIA6_9ASCO|nr:hypothetical protein PMKS-002693 [Pichia membranifaciens]